MEIGLVIYGQLLNQSGGYLYDQKLVEYLARCGDRVEIISIPWRSYPRHLSDNFSAALLQQLGELRVDVLLQDELNHPSLFWLNRKLHRMVNYPIVSIVHHLRSSELYPALERSFYGLVEKLYFQTVDGCIFNSHTTRGVVEGFTGRHFAGVVATPAGDRFALALTPEEVTRRAHRPGDLELVFVGNVIARKGLHDLLQGLVPLAGLPWRLTVVGSAAVDPEYTALCQKMAQAGGIAPQIDWVGRLEVDGLQTLYHDSHVLIVPSSYEGFGIVYLEAMLFGLAAVGGTLGAAGEIIQPDVNGMLTAPGDAGAITRFVSTMIVDRDRLAVYGRNALKRAAEFPGWDDSMARARGFLAEFVAAGRKA